MLTIASPELLSRPEFERRIAVAVTPGAVAYFMRESVLDKLDRLGEEDPSTQRPIHQTVADFVEATSKEIADRFFEKKVAPDVLSQ